MPSLFYAELGGSLGVRFFFDKSLSDIWEKRQGHCEVTESVFVQGDKCLPLFSYNLHKRE